jgi:hypothetical protein
LRKRNALLQVVRHPRREAARASKENKNPQDFYSLPIPTNNFQPTTRNISAPAARRLYGINGV